MGNKQRKESFCSSSDSDMSRTPSPKVKGTYAPNGHFEFKSDMNAYWYRWRNSETQQYMKLSREHSRPKSPHSKIRSPFQNRKSFEEKTAEKRSRPQPKQKNHSVFKLDLTKANELVQKDLKTPTQKSIFKSKLDEIKIRSVSRLLKIDEIETNEKPMTFSSAKANGLWNALTFSSSESEPEDTDRIPITPSMTDIEVFTTEPTERSPSPFDSPMPTTRPYDSEIIISTHRRHRSDYINNLFLKEDKPLNTPSRIYSKAKSGITPTQIFSKSPRFSPKSFRPNYHRFLGEYSYLQDIENFKAQYSQRQIRHRRYKSESFSFGRIRQRIEATYGTKPPKTNNLKIKTSYSNIKAMPKQQLESTPPSSSHRRHESQALTTEQIRSRIEARYGPKSIYSRNTSPSVTPQNKTTQIFEPKQAIKLLPITTKTACLYAGLALARSRARARRFKLK